MLHNQKWQHIWLQNSRSIQWDETVFYPRNCYITSIGNRRVYFTFYKQISLPVIIYAMCIIKEGFVLPAEGRFCFASWRNICEKQGDWWELLIHLRRWYLQENEEEEENIFFASLIYLNTQLPRSCSAASPSSHGRYGCST